MEVYHSTRRDKQNQNLFPTANFHCKVSFVNWPEIRMKTEIAIHILVFHFFFFIIIQNFRIFTLFALTVKLQIITLNISFISY